MLNILCLASYTCNCLFINLRKWHVLQTRCHDNKVWRSFPVNASQCFCIVSINECLMEEQFGRLQCTYGELVLYLLNVPERRNYWDHWSNFTFTDTDTDSLWYMLNSFIRYIHFFVCFVLLSPNPIEVFTEVSSYCFWCGFYSLPQVQTQERKRLHKGHSYVSHCFNVQNDFTFVCIDFNHFMPFASIKQYTEYFQCQSIFRTKVFFVSGIQHSSWFVMVMADLNVHRLSLWCGVHLHMRL